MTKKPFHKIFLYEICTKFLLYATKSFKEFSGDFALFAIRFLPKFDEIDASTVVDHSTTNHETEGSNRASCCCFPGRKMTK
jgi:hypothetical protein